MACALAAVISEMIASHRCDFRASRSVRLRHAHPARRAVLALLARARRRQDVLPWSRLLAIAALAISRPAGVHEVGDLVANHFFGRVADHARHPGVDVIGAIIGVNPPHPVGGRVENLAIALIALGQRGWLGPAR